MGVQEVSGGMWLQILMVDQIQTRLFGDSNFNKISVVGVQASWQGFFFPEITRPWNWGTSLRQTQE